MTVYAEMNDVSILTGEEILLILAFGQILTEEYATIVAQYCELKYPTPKGVIPQQIYN